MMIISVDIKQLDDHISILNEELKEVQAISELLKIRYDQASADLMADRAFLYRQMNCIKNQETYISNRIQLLKRIASKFLDSAHNTENAINEAIYMLIDADS